MTGKSSREGECAMTSPTNPYGDFDEDGMPRSTGKFANSSDTYSSGTPYSNPYPTQQPNVGQSYQDPNQHNFHDGYSNPYQSGFPNQQAPAYSAGFGGPNPHQAYGSAGAPTSDKSKIAAALLAFFLGTLGVHNFYLGHTSRGAIQLALTIVGWITAILLVGFFLVIGVSIWAFVEFILILVGSGSYAYDANGRRLQS